MNDDKGVQPILKAHEDDLVSKVPSFLKEAMPELATPVFSDYLKTKDPILKQKANNNLQALTSFVHKATNYLTGTTEYERPTSNIGDVTPSILSAIQYRENAKGDANVVRTNKDGSKDYGLMQINSSMLPFVKKQFKNYGLPLDVFNPEHSKLAAKMILQDNAKVFKKSVGRPPNDAELVASYNTGVGEAIKEAKAKELRTKPTAGDRYMKASISHG